MRYAIVIEKAEGNFSASSVALNRLHLPGKYLNRL